jgi:hypothetical protein
MLEIFSKVKNNNTGKLFSTEAKIVRELQIL